MTAFEYIAMAVLLGVTDSLNPYMLSGIACCIFWLTLAINNKGHAALAGRSASAAVLLTIFFLGWGVNLLWLASPLTGAIIRLLSLGIAAVLLAVGYLLLRQWWAGKKGTPAPRFPNWRWLNSKSGIICFSIILGIATAMTASLWPKNSNLFSLYYILLSSGNIILVALFFVFYSLAFAGYFVLVCWLAGRVKNSSQLQRLSTKSLSLMKISFSAVCVALGMGLIYLYSST